MLRKMFRCGIGSEGNKDANFTEALLPGDVMHGRRQGCLRRGLCPDTEYVIKVFKIRMGQVGESEGNGKEVHFYIYRARLDKVIHM